MALPTYLELVNEVLVLMREPEVESVTENTLSSVIAKFINQGKRVVEDAWKWNCLFNLTTVSTVAGDYDYSLTDVGHRFKLATNDAGQPFVYNATSKTWLSPTTRSKFLEYLTGDSTSRSVPSWYVIDGQDSSGDPVVKFYGIPDAVYTIKFGLFIPQADLSAGTDTLKVPKEPVINWAYARSLVERGEDGGLETSEAYQIFKSVLADAIAIEVNRYAEEETWEAA